MTDCVFCGDDHYPQGDNTDGSTNGNIKLCFDSGRSYEVPDNICHLILAHDYQPPTSLIGDVMNSRHTFVEPANVCKTTIVVEVDENYPLGAVPIAFPYRLQEIVKAVLANQ
jgi:hypothetical protein